MEMNEMNATVKKQLRGKYIRYAGILFLCTLATSALNVFFPLQLIMESSLLYPLYLLLMLMMIVIRNTVYFLFIKCVRNERFEIKDIRYSLRKSGLHIISALLFEILQLGLLLFSQYVGVLIPIFGVLLTLLIQVMLSAVSLFVAFAIYDGVKGAMNIVNNSFRLMLFQMKQIFRLSMPFLTWLLVYQYLNQYLISHMIVKDLTSVLDVVNHSLHSEATAMYAYGYLALELFHVLISCCILVPLYTALANLYEQDYVNFYPFSSVIQTNMIDIDIHDED